MLAKCGAEVFALSRTQADLDSLKQEVCKLMYSYWLNLTETQPDDLNRNQRIHGSI